LKPPPSKTSKYQNQDYIGVCLAAYGTNVRGVFVITKKNFASKPKYFCAAIANKIFFPAYLQVSQKKSILQLHNLI
jgi:hypothetical protein